MVAVDVTAALAKARFSLSLFVQIKEGMTFRVGPARCFSAVAFARPSLPPKGRVLPVSGGNRWF